MGAFFNDSLHDRLGTWGIGYMPYGGIDHGELVAIGAAVGDGDDGLYYDTWIAAADRLGAEAEEALAKGRRASARDLLLRASGFYVCAYRPLFGPWRDPRLVAARRSQVETFDRALSLFDPPATPLTIPFEGLSLPGYFLPAEGRAGEVRPLFILTNGYDGTITDMYFASAVAASRRGYHVLKFDGPGQGDMLTRHGVPMRPDWEVVINAVVDVAVTLPDVDTDRIVLNGWSLGGYLAPRGASGEPRLAACVADPGQFGMAGAFAAYAVKLGASPDEARDLSKLDPANASTSAFRPASSPRSRWRACRTSRSSMPRSRCRRGRSGPGTSSRRSAEPCGTACRKRVVARRPPGAALPSIRLATWRSSSPADDRDQAVVTVTAARASAAAPVPSRITAVVKSVMFASHLPRTGIRKGGTPFTSSTRARPRRLRSATAVQNPP